ncbi:hypothetical protein CEXT_381191 [Caerostris extrusa]|uniref:Uncharacterized protein n=1 Tax=Caerostris extrusa TaxID=172846 RepID=A0AAV4WQ70_CAEEX|nr:hypothetical protein CEXT_381191 [Caerostris extrusa]
MIKSKINSWATTRSAIFFFETRHPECIAVVCIYNQKYRSLLFCQPRQDLRLEKKKKRKDLKKYFEKKKKKKKLFLEDKHGNSSRLLPSCCHFEVLPK